MAGCGDDDDSGPKLVWSAEANHYFLRLLQGFFHEHGSLGKIDTNTWKSWSKEMSRFFPHKPPYRKLQSKRYWMKKVYKEWEALLTTSGVGWDPVNKVECSNDTWLSYIAVIQTSLHYLIVLKL